MSKNKEHNERPGRWMAANRKEGLTWAAMAVKTGRTVSWLRTIEYDRAIVTDPAVAKLLTKVYDVDPAELLARYSAKRLGVTYNEDIFYPVGKHLLSSK